MSRTRPDTGAGSGPLGRVADAAFVHRRRTLLGWLAVFVVAIAAMAAFGGSYVADYNTPGSDSEAAAKLLDERFSPAAPAIRSTSSGKPSRARARPRSRPASTA